LEYIHGRKATLAIFHDNEKVETVELSKLKTQQEMHELFLSKGFVLKPEEEIAEIKKEMQVKNDGEQKAAEDRRLEKDRRRKEKQQNTNTERPKPSFSSKPAGDKDDPEFFLKERRRKQDEMDREKRRAEMEKRHAEKLEKMSESERKEHFQQMDRMEREREKKVSEKLEKMSESDREAYLKRTEEATKRRESRNMPNLKEHFNERKQQNDEL
jgi:hypothetical protein